MKHWQFWDIRRARAAAAAARVHGLTVRPQGTIHGFPVSPGAHTHTSGSGRPWTDYPTHTCYLWQVLCRGAYRGCVLTWRAPPGRPDPPWTAHAAGAPWLAHGTLADCLAALAEHIAAQGRAPAAVTTNSEKNCQSA